MVYVVQRVVSTCNCNGHPTQAISYNTIRFPGGFVEGHSEKVSFIWSVADLLRGDYKASDYGKVILPFKVLRRLDCLSEPTKRAVLTQAAKLPARADSAMREMLVNRAGGIDSQTRRTNRLLGLTFATDARCWATRKLSGYESAVLEFLRCEART
jgi:hypothetical protein